jgi:hypothetical protein
MVADADADQLIDRTGVEADGDDRDQHRVTRDPAGRVPFQPGPAITRAHRRRGAARSPPGPVICDPLILQRRIGVQLTQLRERHMDQALNRLPGPLRQQPRRQQPPHRFQRIVVTLLPGPQITPRLWRRQRIQGDLSLAQRPGRRKAPERPVGYGRPGADGRPLGTAPLDRDPWPAGLDGRADAAGEVAGRAEVPGVVAGLLEPELALRAVRSKTVVPLTVSLLKFASTQEVMADP